VKRTPLRRKTPLRSKRPTPRTHKLVIRLTGMALLRLRKDCWDRDKGCCQECGTPTFYWPRYDGDPLAYDMAHKRGKRNHGDTLENVRTLCHRCHGKEHNGKIARPLRAP